MNLNPRLLMAGAICATLGACATAYIAQSPTGTPAASAATRNTSSPGIAILGSTSATATSTPRGRAARGPVASPVTGHPALIPGTTPAAAPATMTTADGYHLVWHDEFDKDGPLNPADWGYENGFVRNQEAQFYQPDNAVCKGGFLVIEARKEPKPNPRYIAPANAPLNTPATTSRPAATSNPGIAIPGSASSPTTTAPARGRGRGGRGGATAGWPNLPNIDITAASVNTRGKHEFTYGRFEIRARIDVRSGSWPAFWTLGTAGGWPGNGEVDIMEYYRNMVLANIAWQGPSGAIWNSIRNPLTTFPANFADQFHTWRMDWDEKSIDLFLDDVRVNHQDLSQTVNTGGRGTGVNPFLNKPVYLLLNQAIGGQNGGDYSQTEFPIEFYVDYVRVWQKTPATQQN